MQSFARQKGGKRLDMGQKVGIAPLFALGKLRGRVLPIGKGNVRLDALKRKVRRNSFKRGVPVLKCKGKVDGKGHAAQGERRRERCARLVVGKFALAELCKERVEIEAALFRRSGALARAARNGFRAVQSAQDVLKRQFPADAAHAKVQLPFLQPKLHGAEVGAQRDALRRHIAHIEKHSTFKRRAVHSKGEVENRRTLQNGSERLAEAPHRRGLLLFGARHLAA